ncbi:hypothetical protein DL764_005370 [Monosporascus ibericus]|uniref:Uncharacterized protein n=1 Tax=Monosporascus ibericus TaxID=155417 RepID=A0A4V1XAK9_9PEZI|nr:hypothetical protein DL764_005370 [Monosporascus ibericus]
MASLPSVASSQPDQRHLRLIAAAAQANEERVRDILTENLPWTSTVDHDVLRQSLQKVAARGKLSLVRLLISHGAEVNPRRENEVSALFRAVEGGHAVVVSELLSCNADANCRNRSGQTALFAACLKGHDAVAELLLKYGADVEAKDKEDRTPLLFLASEKQSKWKWTMKTVKLLLDHKANIEAKDQIGRTPLLWAATNGNVDLARVLLANNANIHASNNRGRTALHLAAESNQKDHSEDMVQLLLDSGADPCTASDGGWSALHNAVQNGHKTIVQLLLKTKANVNAQLLNGMTPLHWAAFNGFEDIVRLLLSRPDANLSIKDSFDRTPMLCAAERYNADIVKLLSPERAADRLSPSTKAACKAFEATVVDFGEFEKRQLIAWVESFIEAGHRDIEAFKALEKCFDQEHRGRFHHAHFMRTSCQKIRTPQQGSAENRREDRELTPLSEETSEMSLNSTQSTKDSESKKRNDYCEGNETPKSEMKKKNKSEQIAERHPKKHKRGKGYPGNPPQRQDTNSSNTSARLSVPGAWETSKMPVSSGKIVLFMPFLHYETDARRIEMAHAISDVDKRLEPPENPPPDYTLLEAYLNHVPRLHPRRTLDQFFYHGVDTSLRDEDQVVSRYCERYSIEKKVFMVDQLWLWVLGKDLIITCFPQRWNQPKRDPLNVLDSIIEETNAKTRPPIQSVYDLALLMTQCCSGCFDRHLPHDQDYQFFDMFEHSIGVVTDKESRLFRRFNKASKKSMELLHHHKHGMGRHNSLISDALLDISNETKLLAEIKDIRDELSIIAVILESQLSALIDFEDFVLDEIRCEGNRRVTDTMTAEIRKRAREQRRGIEFRQKDLYRMDNQAQSLYMSLTDLLDLKQKHSNALEARFAADQAVIAAKQGQTIMVFTIVTIIFLPMSFIAALFAINLPEWEGTLSLGYVSKYMFGIGLGISIPLIAMAITFTDIADGMRGILSSVKQKMDGEGADQESQAHEDGLAANSDMPLEAKMEKLEIISTRGRPSTHYNGPDRDFWRADATLRTRHSRERSVDFHGRLSPVSPRENGITWARPSLERGRRNFSEDLERGRSAGPSSRRR